MQKMISKINDAGLKNGMKINSSKTKVMKFCRISENKMMINIGGQIIKKVEEFCYLGVRISNNGRD